MSALTNPYALGGWPGTSRQSIKSEDPTSSPSVLNFRIVHPSTLFAEGATVLAPVDILNCVVLDPYGRKYLSTSTREVPLSASSGVTGSEVASTVEVAITYIHDSQNKVVGQVEWCTPHPILQLTHAVLIPRQKSTYVFFESNSKDLGSPGSSSYSLFVSSTLRTWVNGTEGEYRLYSYDNLRHPVLQVEARRHRTGALELAVTEAGVKEAPVAEAVSGMSNPSTNALTQASSRSSRFYHETVVFEIEGTLYGVSKHGLQQWSRSFFRDLFAQPQLHGEQREGESDTNPIRPPQVTAFEFESLVEVIYSNQLSGPLNLSKDQWVGVLKLARRWDMPEVARLAIENLDSVQLTPLEKVRLGKAHHVLSWITDGYAFLVGDVSPVSFEFDDLKILGLETACRILYARNDVLRATSKRNDTLYCGNCLRYKGSWCGLWIQPQGTSSGNSDPYKCTTCHVSAETSYDGALIYLRPSSVDPGVVSSAIAAKVVQVFREDIERAEGQDSVSEAGIPS